MIRVNAKFSQADLKRLADDIPRRINNVGRVVGRAVAERTAAEVRGRLVGGGWIAIYRNGIFYKELPDGTEWAVAGFSEVELSDPPADTSLFWFVGAGLGNPLSFYNPWTLDLIPAIRGGYDDTVVVRMVAPAAVESRRAELAPIVPNVVQALQDAGAQILPDGEVVIDGHVYADLAFMARRLELGYEGYPRIPHWGPAASAANSNVSSWVSEGSVITAVEDVLVNGKEPGKVVEMSESERDALAKLREATWP